MQYPALRTLRDEHAALAAVLRSLAETVERGPGPEPDRFFEVVRSMLFYLDEFPERLHHPRESHHLFPKLARVAPELVPLIERTQATHAGGERRVRELQHLLAGWELVGEARRDAFLTAAQDYVRCHLACIEVEETQLLPAAGELLPPSDWEELEAVFAAAAEPIATGATRDPAYDRLFSRIVPHATAPHHGAG